MPEQGSAFWAPGGGLVGLIHISKRSGVHPATRLSYHGIGLQGFSVSSWSSCGGGLHHGLGRTKVGHRAQGLLTLHNVMRDAKDINKYI